MSSPMRIELAGLLIALHSGCGANAPPTTDPPPERPDSNACAPAQTWYDRSIGGVFAVVFRTTHPDGTVEDSQLATAFAVAPRRLATNAHVVDGILQRASDFPDAEIVAIQALTGEPYPLSKAAASLDWDSQASAIQTPDVAILIPETDVPVALELATEQDLLRITRGTTGLALAGFPGDVGDVIESIQNVSFFQNYSVTNLVLFGAGAPQNAADADVILHDFPTSGGTSGSPLILCGRVIAIHTGGTADDAADNNFGIQIKHLKKLLADFDAGATSNVDLTSLPTRGSGEDTSSGSPPQSPTEWLNFQDTESSSVCGVANGADYELVILSTGELMLVRGPDVILPGLSIDDQGKVYFQAEYVGYIAFSTDGDGFRTLWVFTPQDYVDFLDPANALQLPSDFSNVPCDACGLVDAPAAGQCP